MDLLTSLMIEIDPLILQGDAPLANILFVGMYRSEEVEADHILSEKYFPLFEAVATLDVMSIQLQPFTEDDCNSMISSVLKLPLRLTRALAKAVHAKTSGNIFYIVSYGCYLLFTRRNFSHYACSYFLDCTESLC